jgi:6-phosphogluconate dehydrogenase
MLADIGLIGLAVMGENLVLNLESKGYTVAVFNRTVSKVDCFTAGRGKGKAILGCHSLEELIKNTKSPHIIMLMIKAGLPVEELIKQLIPLLSSGDVIIDGGNSNYNDTERRVKLLESKGLYFIGTGISGGEIGALTGPAIMPGGSHGAWKLISQMFFDISAKAGQKQTPCCNWVGNGGAGHFVKMVHNGIEYGDMQLICEIYWIMKKALHMNNI